MASQSASTTQGAGSTSAPTVVQILPNNRNPQIWKDFNLCLISDNTKKAQCIHCLHFFSKDSNSTLKNHISHPHFEALKRVAKLGQSSMSRDWSLFVYNPDVLREQFAGLVIQRGLPFNHFDDEKTTRVFQKHLQPKYNHVSRTTLKRDALKLWVAAKQVIFIIQNMVTQQQPNQVVWVGVLHRGQVTGIKFLEGKGNNVFHFIPHGHGSVQATSVASESAFLTSEKVLSIRRTRLTPASLEMCMCLKDHLDAQEHKQDKSTLETLVDFKKDILNADVQANEAISLSDEEITLDVASSEGSMSGPGSGGDAAEAKANYGYNVYHDDY
nr:zinc finger, BED-type, phospholipase-like, homeodomain-like protein [Tanacetum cinerariifolium]